MKQITGTNYFITDDGRVLSLKKGNRYLQLKHTITPQGYKGVKLCVKGIYRFKLIHRLLAEYYLETWNSKLQVNHKDLNKLNNNISNLEMMTSYENIKHYLKSINVDTYKIRVIHKGFDWDVVVNTLEEARKICGYKTRASIWDCLNNGTKNRKGYTFEKIFI